MNQSLIFVIIALQQDFPPCVVYVGFVCVCVAAGGETFWGNQKSARCLWLSEVFSHPSSCPILVRVGGSCGCPLPSEAASETFLCVRCSRVTTCAL